MSEPSFRKSAGGLLIGPNSSAPSNSLPAMVMYSSPTCVYTLVRNRDWALFLHGVFALRDAELGMLEANFVSTIAEFMGVIQNRAADMVRTIATGMPPPDMVLDDAIMRALMPPLPLRAKEVELALMSAGPAGLVPRLWPRMYAIISCDTGSFEIYRTALDPLLLRGGEGDPIPILSPFLAATEGLIGCASDLYSKTYSPVGALFMEFIDASLSNDAAPPPTVALCDLVMFFCVPIVSPHLTLPPLR